MKLNQRNKLRNRYKFIIVLVTLLLMFSTYIVFDVLTTHTDLSNVSKSNINIEPVLDQKINFFKTNPDLILENAQ